jgi:hypothetical protein
VLPTFAMTTATAGILHIELHGNATERPSATGIAIAVYPSHGAGRGMCE